MLTGSLRSLSPAPLLHSLPDSISPAFLETFEHLPQYRILRCRQCSYAVPPVHLSTHLSTHHPQLTKDVRRSLIADVKTVPSLAIAPDQVVLPNPSDQPVLGFQSWTGLRCMTSMASSEQCGYVCRTLQSMQKHCREMHGWANSQTRGGNKRAQQTHTENRSWEADVCIQRFFEQPQWRRYFAVTATSNPVHVSHRNEKDRFFEQQQQTMTNVRADAAQQADVVAGFDSHRSTVIPWLRRTGIEQYLIGREKGAIHAVTQLPNQQTEPIAGLLVQEFAALLTDAHQRCFDSYGSIVSWPRLIALSRFQPCTAAQVGHTRPFEINKEPATIHKYISLGQRFLAYFSRTVSCTDAPLSAHDVERKPRANASFSNYPSLRNNSDPSGKIPNSNKGNDGDESGNSGKSSDSDESGDSDENKQSSDSDDSSNSSTRKYDRDPKSGDGSAQSKDQRRGPHPSPEQQRIWHRLTQQATEHLQATEQRPTLTSTTLSLGLRATLLEWFLSVIRSRIGTRRYDSPIICFCALLAIQPTSRSWHEAGNYSSYLSAVIWLAQLALLERCAQEEQANHGDALASLEQDCARYLYQGTETPFGELLRWRLLTFQVSKNTVSLHQAEWDVTEQIVQYEDVRLPLSEVQRLLQSEYHACYHLLHNELLFGIANVPFMRSSRLEDSISVTTTNWSFLQHHDNQPLIEPAERALLNRIRESAPLTDLYVDTSDRLHGRFRWHANAIAMYEAAVQRFLEHLCVLVHISSGQPLRESEFFSMTWRNTERIRAITIRHQRVMIHTTYHKNQQQMGKHKDNVRFLPAAVGDMLLNFLVYVMPLRHIFARQDDPTAVIPPFLWSQRTAIWRTGKLSECLSRASVRAQTPPLHVSNWRQFSVAIVKTKFASAAACFDPDDGDPDGEEIDDDIRAMTQQRNHTTRTVNRAYANQSSGSFANVWDGLIKTGLRASTLWQEFWEVDRLMHSTKRKHDGQDSLLSQRIAMRAFPARRTWTSEDLLARMRALWRDPQMEWRSAAQASAMSIIMAGTRDVVAVFPTGSGKSLFFMLPPTLPSAGVTIVIVPLVALRADMIRRLQERSIPCLLWPPRDQPPANLVLVSVEAAGSKEFRIYASTLEAQGRLDRIVLDECHLTITAAHYRSSMAELAELRGLRTQFVYLTATLPPTMCADFIQRNLLHQPTFVRVASNRPNLRYDVRTTKPHPHGFLHRCAHDVRRLWDNLRMTGRIAHRARGIIYVRRRADAVELAELLSCSAYSTDLATPEAKADVLARWLEGPEPFVVATTALAEGFDYATIRAVVHVDEPESLVTWAQQSGRAGRDGLLARCSVLLPPQWRPRDPDAANEGPLDPSAWTRDPGLRHQHDQAALQTYLQGQQCYRTTLSEYLDEPGDRRWCMAEDHPCQVCRIGHTTPIGPALARIAPPTHVDPLRQRRFLEQTEMDEYRQDLDAVRGTCLFCYIRQDAWTHVFDCCPHRQTVIDERQRTFRRHQSRWLKPYTACFKCLNPQTLCPRPPSDQPKLACEYPDVVLPLCVGLYHSPKGEMWLRDRFSRRFSNISDYMDWLGTPTDFGGSSNIQAVRVAARALADRRGALPGAATVRLSSR